MTVDVKNSGGYDGKEVVELYVAAPDSKASNKPVKELKAFAKTALLHPGETATVTLTAPASDLASYSDQKTAWVVDQGTYQFLVGASSADIRATLEATVAAREEKVHNALPLRQPISTISR